MRYGMHMNTKIGKLYLAEEDGLKFSNETKDWLNQSLKWHEMSIANAAEYDLKPVAVIGKSVLVYKRPYSDKPLPWENGNENLNVVTATKEGIMLFIIAFCIGVIGGFLGAILF